MPSLSSVPVFSTEGVVDSWRVSMLCAGAVVNAAGATMEREVFEWAEERTEKPNRSHPSSPRELNTGSVTDSAGRVRFPAYPCASSVALHRSDVRLDRMENPLRLRISQIAGLVQSIPVHGREESERLDAI